MRKIRETIVVEGKDDERALKQLYDVNVIKTDGTHLSAECLQQIRISREINGVIILTDQDHPGEEIRRKINEAVPGCRNAFLTRKNVRKNGIGVEHATPEEIEEALRNLISFDEREESISRKEFNDLGLQGKENSSYLRSEIEEYYHLGHGSAKTLWKRMNSRGLTYQEIKEWINEKRYRNISTDEGNSGNL